MPDTQTIARKKVPEGQLLINGTWRDAQDGATMPTVDPTTEEVTTTVAKASPADADAAVQAASRAFEEGPWGKMHHEERAKIMLKIADLIDARGEDIAYRETVDMGMPYSDFMRILVPQASGMFRFCAGLAMTSMGGAYRQSYEPDLKIITKRQPLGVVAAISPFNFPFILSVSKVAPAFAAGNTIVHKPASDTPLSAIALGQIMLDAGVPDGVSNLVTGPGGSIGDALVKHPLVDKVAFTGSTKVGQGIIRTGADTMKHTTMELGRQGAQHHLRGRQHRQRGAGCLLGHLLEQGRGLRRRLQAPRGAARLRRGRGEADAHGPRRRCSVILWSRRR